MTNCKDTIIVAHSVHADIAEDEMRAAIPPAWTVRGVVDVRPARLPFTDTLVADWVSLARAQTLQWETQVRPLLEHYQGASIAYFGLAPIPLAFHLGSLTERWPSVNVYLRHHEARSWIYPGGQEPTVRGPEGPHEPVRATDPAIITLSTTVPVDVDAARKIVGATSAEIELRTAPFGEDVLVSEQAVRTVGGQFREALALLEKNRPGVSEIHFFGAIPVGLAFLLGSFITATRHARIVTYQYHRSSEPRFVEALRLPQRAATGVTLTDDDVVHAAALRAMWENERQAVVAFARDCEGHWSRLLGKLGTSFESAAFGKLEAARDTPLTSAIDLATRTVEDGFQYDRDRCTWMLSDGLLSSVGRLVSITAIARAGRMLLLHEALHHGKQGVTAATARQIRLAPKVLEELDYLADVWAMMHEFAFSGFVAKSWLEQRSALIEILETAVSTMWAFDDDRERGLLEVRRINRYLIWYVTLARIERTSSAVDAMSILANKPVIELVGPRVELRDGRLVARLDRPDERPYELCLLGRRGELRRLGSTNAMSVSSVATALGAHDHDGVRAMVRGFLEAEP